MTLPVWVCPTCGQRLTMRMLQRHRLPTVKRSRAKWLVGILFEPHPPCSPPFTITYSAGSFSGSAAKRIAVGMALARRQARRRQPHPARLRRDELRQGQDHDRWLNACSRYCMCCHECAERPCAGAMAGGVCDQLCWCSYNDDTWDDDCDEAEGV